MKEFIDKLISRLEELPTFKLNMADAMSELMKKNRLDNYISREEVVSIVNELAEEHNGGWIPCSERLPEVDGRYLCSYHYKDGGRNYVQVLSYYAYDEKPHFQHEGYEGLEVVAWCELPAPYTEGE